MDPQVLQALKNDRVVDITTTGRTSGLPRRIETSLYVVSDGFALSGRPGRPRSWYANLLAHPDFTVHVKRGAQADLPARAAPVPDPAERRRLITEIVAISPAATDVEAWVAGSPLVRVTLE
jgi:deazaflavin-dependent oxidoreductase (nitroreductase family)